MAHALWTGAIRFGLVNVPVRLSSAVSPREVRFHMLHEPDGGRIRFKRVCAIDGAEVEQGEIVKGYEVARGRYVRIDPKELERLDPQATHAIEIEEFVDAADIDPIFYEQPYQVHPDKGAGRAYGLLVEAMRRTGKVAIARMVMRTKGYLCALRPVPEGLVLSTMLYADEVVPRDEMDLPAQDREPSARELDMAVQLIGSLTATFDPTRYRDEHREKVLALIEKKVSGEEVVAPPEEERPAKVLNLADALAASLEARKGAPKQPEKKAEREREPAAPRRAKRQVSTPRPRKAR